MNLRTLAIIIQDTFDLNVKREMAMKWEEVKLFLKQSANLRVVSHSSVMIIMISQELDSDQLLNIHASGERGSLMIT